MRVNRVLLGSAVWAFVFGGPFALAGCSSSSDAGSGGGAIPALNPPANIDVKLCANITGDFSTIAEACGTCCTKGGFSASTSYDNQCVCGNQAQDDTTCTAKDESSCPTCCTGAGYSGYSFFGDPGSSTCSCIGKFDDQVCLSAASAADGASACQVCCLNHGYLGDGYSNFGTPECDCN